MTEGVLGKVIRSKFMEELKLCQLAYPQHITLSETGMEKVATALTLTAVELFVDASDGTLFLDEKKKCATCGDGERWE